MVFKVFVDTNVILDIFLKREPFFDNSKTRGTVRSNVQEPGSQVIHFGNE